MKSLADVDPELSILKSLGSSLAGANRQTFERARFNLFTAFEKGNSADAQRWSEAVLAAISAAEASAGRTELVSLAREALRRINDAIEAEP